jgi:hypothetical protein
MAFLLRMEYELREIKSASAQFKKTSKEMESLIFLI